MAYHLRAWGPAATWAAVLFLLSAQDAATIDGPWFAIPDEILHLGVYTVLGATLAHGRRLGAPAVPHSVLIALGAAFAASDEWHQSFVPGRSPTLTDWLADVVGLCLGYSAAWWLAGRFGREPAHGEQRAT